MSAFSLATVADLASLGPGDHETRTIRAPFTGERIAELPLAGPADLDHAVSVARAAQPAWEATRVAERVRLVRRFRARLLDEADSMLDVLQLETGKARRHGFEELADVAMVSGYYAHAAPRLLGVRSRRGAVPGFTRAREERYPHGVVGVIAPWNYPLATAVSDALPALLAGNAVIVKPDVQTTHTALAALRLMRAAGIPDGVFQVVPGDGPAAGGGLVDRADYIAFTGSTATGRVVAERAGRRLVGCSLELGGKNAMIVRGDAELRKAVAGAVRGSFANAGQLCVSCERLYVHGSLFDEFVPAFARAAGALELGAGFDYEADLGSLTYPHQLEKVTAHVADALARGARVHTGGKARPDLGPLFYEPTVLTDVTRAMRLYAEETFGPVVSVFPFSTDDEVVDLANDGPYGLSASVWSSDVGAARRLASRLEVGNVSVNESYSAAWGSVDSPMGGWKESGIGRRHGAEGLLKFTRSKTVAVQRGVPLNLAAPWLRRKGAREAVLGILRRYTPRSGRP